MDSEGKRLKERGIAIAAANAGEAWMAEAVADFARFVRDKGETTAEQWRYDWLARGEPAPVSHKAYGAVANAARLRGLIRKTGRYVPAQSARTHSHPVTVWRSAE
jgi:hypothetical protein